MECVLKHFLKRDILDQMAGGLRVDPTIIQTYDTGPRAKGGQGTVMLGTVQMPGERRKSLPISEFKVAVKKLEWDREDPERSTKFFKVNSLLGLVSRF